jgi:hypothetical protein
MANGIKQTNDGFNSIYKGNFSIGINNISYGSTNDTGFWNTKPTYTTAGDVAYAYIQKGSNGPSIYEMTTNALEVITGINQIATQIDGPFITTSTFTTTRNITIPSNSTASTYPLEFNVSGINSNANFVTLTLGILSGSNVQNLGIVLVAPDNSTYALIKGSLAFGIGTTGEISVTLSRFKGPYVATSTPWDGYSGGFFDTNSYNGGTTLNFAAPCPVGPFDANQSYFDIGQFTNFSSGSTNGTWSLYIQDFGGAESTLLYSNLSITTNALNFSNALSWAASNDDVVIINRDYPSIVVSDLQLHIDPWYLPSANAYYWFPNVSEGNKISDLTNNNNDATTSLGVTLEGTNYNYWGLNNPFTFDTVTNIPAGNSAYTLSVWFRVFNNSLGLISFGTNTSYAANFLFINGSGYISNEWCGTTITSTGSTVTDNIWHNAVVTYDGTIATIYIDGVFDTNLTVGSSLNVSPTSNLKIGGAISGYSANDFNGSMGPVMIYNRALSDNEVLTNYNSIHDSHDY